MTLEELRRAEKLNFDQCIKMEERLAYHFMQSADFFEGVRAALIDKDHKPHWRPSQLNEISEKEIDAFFL